MNTSLPPTPDKPNELVLHTGDGPMIVNAGKACVLVSHGWTVAIAVGDMLDYVRNFGRNSAADCLGGFVLQDGRYILSHHDAKMTLTPEHGETVVAFLTGYYGLDQPPAIAPVAL